jgi:hypothetical protein
VALGIDGEHRKARGQVVEPLRWGAVACEGIAPTTEMRTGLVSGTVNIDIIISIDRFAERTRNGDRQAAAAGRRGQHAP